MNITEQTLQKNNYILQLMWSISPSKLLYGVSYSWYVWTVWSLDLREVDGHVLIQVCCIISPSVILFWSCTESHLHPDFWWHSPQPCTWWSTVPFFYPVPYRIMDFSPCLRPVWPWNLSQASYSWTYPTTIRCVHPWHPRSYMAHPWLGSELVWHYHAKDTHFDGNPAKFAYKLSHLDDPPMCLPLYKVHSCL